LAQVARQTSGLTGAELANVCNEAAIKAGRRSASSITQSDFDWALERVVAGLQQRKMLTEKERRILAYHEAGHALMAHLMGSVMELQKVTIVSRGNALGDDEAAARRGAGASDRWRLRGGGTAAPQAPRSARPGRGRAAREGDPRPRGAPGPRRGHRARVRSIGDRRRAARRCGRARRAA